MSDTVFIKKADSYDNQTTIDAAIEDILLGCGIDALVENKRNVVIKANLVMRAKPDEAVTTSPEIVRAVITALKKRGVEKVVVADSPGGVYTKSRLRAVYDGCGFLSLEKTDGVILNYDTDSKEVAVGGERVRRFEIIQPILDADLVINVARLKTHAMAGLSAAVKNLFGCVPGLKKAEWHSLLPAREAFCEMIIDLAEYVKPQISIVDGIVGMEGDGPSGGTPRSYHILAGSNNPYHLDGVLAQYIGMRPDEALTVGASIRRGLCPESSDGIDVKGDTDLLKHPISDLKKPRSRETDFSLRVPKIFQKPVKMILDGLAAHPAIIKKKCIACGRCKEICPQQVIAIVDKNTEADRFAAIDKKGCIRCFCCHEVCPARAIDIKRSFVWGI